MSTSSDSSDDEEMQKFRDAADPQLLNDSMFNNTKKQDTSSNKKIISQRSLQLEETHYNDINISESTQKHFQKKLSHIINKQIKFVDFESSHKNDSKDEEATTGVKLLKNSKHFLDDFESDQINCIEHNKKHRKNEFNDKLNEKRCKEVAVNGNDVLAKLDTKHWSNRSKAQIFSYKKDKQTALCTLISDK